MKEWWKSKAVWLGILTCVGAIIEFILKAPVGMATGTLLLGIIQIIIRFLTNTAITTPSRKK